MSAKPRAVVAAACAVAMICGCGGAREGTTQMNDEFTARRKRSLAMQRFRCDDSENEFYTRFRYQPVKGLGYEPGVPPEALKRERH